VEILSDWLMIITLYIPRSWG